MMFGQRLIESRKQKKLSQNDLGKLAGVSGDIVGKYERGEMKPSIETAKKLANALGISLDYLMGDTELKVLDATMIKRLEAIEQMPDSLKDKVLFFIDMTIRDFKARKAYS